MSCVSFDDPLVAASVIEKYGTDLYIMYRGYMVPINAYCLLTTGKEHPLMTRSRI